jgi:peptidylprolyl isomerase
MPRAKKGDRVKLHIVGRTSDGVVIETTEGCDPLLVEVGGDQLLAGLQKAIVGMDVGEEQKVVVPPEEAYGVLNPELQYVVSNEILPKGTQAGDKLHGRAGERKIEVWVREIGEENTIVDENHPLAGETLEFDLKLVSIES